MTTQDMITEINKSDNKRERLEEYISRFAFKQHLTEDEVRQLKTFKDYVKYLYHSTETN